MFSVSDYIHVYKLLLYQYPNSIDWHAPSVETVSHTQEVY